MVQNLDIGYLIEVVLPHYLTNWDSIVDTRGRSPVLVSFVSIISSFSQLNFMHTGVGCIVFADDLITASMIYDQISCQSELKLSSCDHSFRQSWSLQRNHHR